MTALILRGVLSYLLGSVIGSLLIARLTGGADIRTLGSGNAGATNALRTMGKGVALGVFVIDVAKGWIATAWIATGTLPGIGTVAAELAPWSVPVCGTAVMLGHVYPLWYGLRGGKGVATLIGAVAGVSPALLAPMILTWLVAVVAFGYVGIASILAAMAFAAWTALRAPASPLLVFAVLAALLILYTHRANLARVRAGTESRARTLWLFGTRRGRG